MLTPITVTLYHPEEELQHIEFDINSINSVEDDYLQDKLEQTEMGETDATIASVQLGKTLYEICTTCNRSKLYLFESELDEEGNAETVDAYNISSELKRLCDWYSLVLSLIQQS